ncbi:MAG: peptide chain release factor N(5)-glutamine methyltransferase [Pseudomonadota bacterium]
MTLEACLRAGARDIAAARACSMAEAMMEARLIAGHVTGLDAAGLLMAANAPLSAERRVELERALERRASGEPVAYIVGERGFWEHRFLCRPGVLIPRPDTEILVEWALERIPAETAGYRVLDLGTGSGAIALSMAAARPAADVLAVDRHAEAVALARDNREHLRGQGAHAEVALWQGDWLSAVRSRSIDLLVSNPPYLSDRDPHLKQGDLRFEPKTALIADERGLADYRRLLQSVGRVLRPGGVVLFEHGAEQADAVARLMAEAGLVVLGTREDFGGNPRVTAALLPSPGD